MGAGSGGRASFPSRHSQCSSQAGMGMGSEGLPRAEIMEPSLKGHQEHAWASSPEGMGTSIALMPLGESRETPLFPEQGGKASAEARVSKCS